MSDEATQIGIGELARRAGLSIRTVRFYSDAGVLPESGRTAAGYRRYDREAVARARLLRTLRELGVDLPTVRRVLEGAEGVGEVAARHAAALDARIRDLRLQRGVLRAIAQEPDDPTWAGCGRHETPGFERSGSCVVRNPPHRWIGNHASPRATEREGSGPRDPAWLLTST